MAILLLGEEGRYCKLINQYVYRVGRLPEDEALADHIMLDLIEDATVLSTKKMKDVEIARVWKKFGNGMGSTNDAPAFVEAMILAGAEEVK